MATAPTDALCKGGGSGTSGAGGTGLPPRSSAPSKVDIAAAAEASLAAAVSSAGGALNTPPTYAGGPGFRS